MTRVNATRFMSNPNNQLIMAKPSAVNHAPMVSAVVAVDDLPLTPHAPHSRVGVLFVCSGLVEALPAFLQNGFPSFDGVMAKHSTNDRLTIAPQRFGFDDDPRRIFNGLSLRPDCGGAVNSPWRERHQNSYAWGFHGGGSGT